MVDPDQVFGSPAPGAPPPAAEPPQQSMDPNAAFSPDNNVGTGVGKLFYPGQEAIAAGERGLNDNAADRTGNIMAAEMMKGIPAVGQAVPWMEKNIVPESAHVSPEMMANFEDTNSTTAKGLQAAGSALTTAPLFAAAPSLAGSMGVGAGLGAAESAAEGNKGSDVLTDGARGAAGAVIGHYLGNPSQIPGKAGQWLSQGIPKWDQLPQKFQDRVGNLIMLGALGHAVHTGMNEGFHGIGDIWEHLAELSIGAGASGHAGGMFGRLIPRTWDAVSSMPNAATRFAQKTPASRAIVQAGINHLSRGYTTEPVPESTSPTTSPPPSKNRGGRARAKKSGGSVQTSRAMRRAVVKAFAARKH